MKSLAALRHGSSAGPIRSTTVFGVVLVEALETTQSHSSRDIEASFAQLAASQKDAKPMICHATLFFITASSRC
jgi:hypothetical protein